MKKRKNKSFLIPLIIFVGGVGIASSFANICLNDASIPSYKIKTKLDNKLVIGFAKYSKVGDFNLFDNAAYQCYFDEDFTEDSIGSSLEYFKDQNKDMIDSNHIYLDNVMNSAYRECFDDDPQGKVVCRIMFDVPVDCSKVALSNFGINTIKYYGTDDSNIECVIVQNFRGVSTQEVELSLANELGCSVGMIELIVNDIEEFTKINGFVESGYKSNNSINVEINKNHRSYKVYDFLSTDSLLFTNNIYKDFVFFDLGAYLTNELGVVSIDEWLHEYTYSNSIKVITYCNYLSVASSAIEINESGLYLIGVPLNDGEVPLVKHSSYYQEVIYE